MFRSARVKLTAAYTLGIAVITGLFSVALYLALQRALTGNLEVEGNATAQLEHAILAAELARVRLALLAVNLAGWAISALISYVVAGRTLRPIEAALDRQRRFAAHASHELRTPLTVMKGEIDVTLARQRSGAVYRETLERVNVEVDHLEGTVRSLLDLVRSAGGPAVIRGRRREVRTALQEMVEPFRLRAENADVGLGVEAPPDLGATLAWEDLEHVLRNLLDNALRHTPPGGEIRVSARQHARDLELAVFNSGSHIAADDLPHLFVPFYRGRGRDSETGTGLGLALCAWVVEAQGGSIEVQNVPGGALFAVRVPRMK